MKRNNNGTFSLDDDEIECLQRALDAEFPSVSAEDGLDRMDGLVKRIRELEAENKRLRETLALIEDSSEHEHHYAVRLARRTRRTQK